MANDMQGFPYVPPWELDYAERTTTLSVTGSSATNTELWIGGKPIYLDGQTKIKVDFFAYLVDCTSAQQLLVHLFDETTDLGRIGLWGSSSGTLYSAAYCSMVLKPAAGHHKYQIRAWRTGGTANIYAGVGGANVAIPSWYRVTKF